MKDKIRRFEDLIACMFLDGKGRVCKQDCLYGFIQIGDCACGVKLAHREIHAKLSAHAPNQTHGQQRMPA